MKFLNIIFFLLTVSVINIAQSNVIQDGDKYFFADRVIVKYKNSNTELNKTSNKLFSKFNIYSSSETFNRLDNEYIISGELQNIYTLKFSSPYNPKYVIKEISKLKNVEWAEPHYLYELTFDPNDPIYTDPITSKYEHLEIIKAKEAWDINKGSEEIVIAIVDTGVDWDHPDLVDNIWINSAETPDNGIDDDENGFIDDYRGWDFGGSSGTPDKNPTEDASDHGTHVAGLASASTNNGVGISSIGFNSKIMAVKTSQNDLRSDNGTALIAYGYEGIKYAADQGADVINCSWGGFNYSFAAQGVIDYAISKGALVVASAGNDNTTDNFYPASYDGVLSVAGTDFNDIKASWSNYGTKVDVCSPGVGIYSTWYNNTYATKSGTSMSSPIAAGLAGLVVNQFPDFTPLQIAEQIRVNSDKIDNVNPAFKYDLGYGRINAFKALSNNNSKSIRITNIELVEVGDMDGIYEAGESIKIKLDLINYLSSLSSLAVNISSYDQNIEIVKSGGNLGSINSLQNVQTNSDFIEILIKPTSADDVDAEILVSYTDSDYEDFELFTISINPTYEIHTTENLSITFNSRGSIGFDDYPTNLKGTGLIFKDEPNLMFEGALVYGTSANSIVNTARNVDGDKDEDFSVITPILLKLPGSYADKETYTKFNDALASPISLGIETEVYSYSFSNDLDANYMFIRYVFNNKTSETINNFYAGQYWDFDMDDTSYDDDLVSYNSDNSFGYVHDDDGNPTSAHIGFALLSSDKIGFFAMDTKGTNDSIISWDGFSDIEKWTALSSGLDYPSVGPSDISVLISGGPFDLEPGVKFDVDFVVAAGDNLSDLTKSVTRARLKYKDFPTGVESDQTIISNFYLKQNYPNPFNPTTTISYTIPSDENISKTSVQLIIYDVLGREVITLLNQEQKSGTYEIVWNASELPSGVYYYRLLTDNFISIKKMILLK